MPFQNVVELFDKTALILPDAIAIRDSSQVVSYKELRSRTNTFAAYLQHFGTQREELCFVFVSGALASIESLLSVLKSGKIYVPLSLDFPDDLLKELIESYEPAWIILDQNTASRYQLIQEKMKPSARRLCFYDLSAPVEGIRFGDEGQFISVDDDPGNLQLQKVSLGEDDPCYIYFTSGTSGQPKAILGAFRGINHFIDWELNFLKPSAPLKVSQLTAPSFDAFLRDIFVPLCSGGTICIPLRENGLLVLDGLLQWLKKEQINLIHCVPTLAREIINISSEPFSLPDLQHVLLSGESLYAEDLRNWSQQFGKKARIVNLYGPSETTMVKFAFPVDWSKDLPEAIPIGKPIQGSKAILLDDQLMPCRQGVIGELYIRTAYRSLGYYKNEELTKQAFILHPMAKSADDLLYKTGDLAIMDAEGNFHFKGRKDFQVKIKGVRVELGAIESHLRAYPNIEDAVVAYDQQTEVLTACIKSKTEIEELSIKDYLTHLLPVYMHPAYYLFKAEFPQNSNGKTDRKLLNKEMQEWIKVNKKEFTAASNPIEEELSAIWKNLLKVEQVSIRDNFFEIGGHSLMAIRVVSRVRKKLKANISINDVFANPTIESLARLVGDFRGTDESSAIVPGQRPERIPLSYSQERLWFIDQLGGSTEYHIPYVQYFKAGINIEALEFAFQQIIHRHEILRTLIQQEEGVPFQLIVSGEEWMLETEDWSDAFSSGQFTNAVEAYIYHPFNLAADLPFRAKVYQLKNGQCVLALSMHHIVSDAWSQNLIVKELITFYQAKLSGKAVEISRPELQYADFSIWQRKNLSGKQLEEKLTYWENQLSGVAPLELPLDSPRPAIQSTKGNSLTFELDADLTQQLTALSVDKEVTMFMLLLSAFKLLLYRYCGQTDICVGSPVANRDQKELENLLGFFVNTIALRSNLDHNPSFLELLAKIKATTLEAYKHQSAPFEKVVDRLIEQRDRSRSPVFQTMFVLQNTPEELTIEEAEAFLTEGDHSANEFSMQAMRETARFDLVLNAHQAGEKLNFELTYCSDLFKEETIQRMGRHFKTLLSSIVQSPNAPINAMSLMEKEEKQLLLKQFNATERAFPAEKTAVDLFAKKVVESPNQIALIYNDQQLSYTQLDQRSNQLAHYLIAQRLDKNSLIGICLDRSVEMIVSVLAVLKTGAAYVPIDPAYPTERIRYILEDSRSALVISSGKHKPKLKNSGTNLLCLDEETVAIEAMPATALNTAIAPTDLMYVIYTSGSTGRPKGVMIEHRSNVNMSLDQIRRFDIQSSDRILQFASLSFDASVSELFMAFYSGAALVMIDKELLTDAGQLLDYSKSKGVSVATFPPVYLKALNREALHFLRVIITAGEAADPEDALYFAKHLNYHNAYGPTECAVCVSSCQVDPKLESERTGISIGTPIVNMRVYILNEYQALCPIGVEGELCVSGVGLARGYWEKKVLTDQQFVENPYERDALMYRTGDLVKWLPDGRLEYIGRKDEQLKIRSYRIEPGEVEAVLSSSELVNKAFVMAQKDQTGSPFLVAYLDTTDSYSQEAMFDYLRAELPEYMIPTVLLEVDEFPLTVNGKVDKKALPMPEALLKTSKQYLAPRNKEEERLTEVWKELLGVEKIGVNDDFFELGGHSLLAMRVVSAIEKEFACTFGIKQFFETPTIAGIAEQLKKPSTGRRLPAIVQYTERGDFIPLSFSQERLWFLDQLSGSTAYHIPFVQTYNESFDANAFEWAVQSLIDRHEVLRTLIKEKNGRPYQMVMPENNWKLIQTEVREKEAPADLADLIDQKIKQPFDLARDYPIRAELLHFSDKGYVLILVIHHIASDGWSNAIFRKELFELYEAKCSNLIVEQEKPAIQYADYSIWQQKYLVGDLLEEKLAYWEKQLKGIQPLELPLDFARPRLQSYKGDRRSYELGKNLSAKVRKLSQEYSVTDFMTLLAAFKVLLFRYSGQTDLCVGSPIANRQQKELEKAIGFFINTIALRSDLSAHPSFQDLLVQVKQTTLDAYSQQDAPFEKVVERLVQKRDMSRGAIFQVLFVLQKDDTQNAEPDNSILHKIELPRTDFGLSSKIDHFGTSKYDLAIHLTESDGQWAFDLEYCTDLFKRTTIDRIGQHFIQLLNALIEQPEASVALIDFMSAEEKKQLLDNFNGPQLDIPLDKTMVDLWAEQVVLTPNKIAITFEEQSLTYQELDRQSNQLARHLQQKGVKEETLVGICIYRSVEMMIGLLGIIKAGGAYVPIDPEYPQSRIDYILENAGIRLVVGTEESLSSIKASEKLAIDKEWGVITSLSDEPIDVTLSPENLFYVIYTSGSTGRPKGVMNQHDGLVNRLLWAQHHYQLLAEEDVVLQKTTFCFDVSVWELFWPLITGVRLVLARPGGHKDNAYLKSIIEKEKITTLHFVPSMMEVFVLDVEKGDCSSLRRVLCSGEELKVKQVNDFQQKLEHVALHNLYGPTEAAIDVSYWDVPQNDSSLRSIPIGQAVANTSLYVMDQEEQLVPLGIAGELHIGGIQVARGYLNQPKLTAERFIHAPFTATENDRLYKTGDLVRWLPDGNLEYLGRIDHQVKIRGFRIELGEIEFALSEFETIQQSVVIARPDTNGTLRLIAFVVASGEFIQEEAKNYLKARLPEYMVPAFIFQLEEMPLSANGKIDRKALPEVNKIAGATNEYLAPRTELESHLVNIWKTLLGVEKIGVLDDFFEIGGHSLLAMRVISAIQKELSYELDIQDFFLSPSIEGIAAKLKEGDSVSLLPAISPEGERPAKIPLSYAQERIWFIHKLMGSTHYHIPFIRRFNDQLDIEQFEKAFKKLVNRHEVLRTLILEDETGMAYQKVLPKDQWTMGFTTIEQALSSDELSSRIEKEVNQPIDLAKDHLLRAQVFELPHEKTYVLVLVVHHIASDAWSGNILIKELFELYAASKYDYPNALPPLPIQYADYAIWQRKHLSGIPLEAKLAYWEKQLQEITPLELPLDFARPAIQSSSGKTIYFDLSKTLTEDIYALARKENVTLYILLLTVFKVLLYRYSGQTDICVGSPMANRGQKDLENLIGFFLNTVAIRSDLNGNPTFAKLLARVKTTSLEAFKHQDAPFEKVIDRVVKVRDMSRSPLFNVLYSLQNTNVKPAEAKSSNNHPAVFLEKELGICEMPHEYNISKYDLTLNTFEEEDQLSFSIEYCTDLFREESIHRMKHHFVQLLNEIVENANQEITALNLLTATELDQIHTDFNQTAVDYPLEKTFAELFTAKAIEQPDQLALVFGEETLSYGELAEKSDRLAAYLLENKAAKNELIGICLDRSPQMLIGLLGILKSGNAFVPIDPEYPADRIDYVIQNSGIQYLISTENLATAYGKHPHLNLILLDDEASYASPRIDLLKTVSQQADDLAYVIYTSGSTGKPKGVMIEQSALLNFLFAMQETFRFSNASSILAVTTYSFDISYLELFLPLLSGGTVVLANREAASDGYLLKELLAQFKPSHMQATPITWQMLLDCGWENEEGVVVMSGGEAIKEQLKNALTTISPNGVWNLYGPTETTIWSTCKELKAEEKITIGRPISNTQIYILDTQNQSCPVGITGELCIGGFGLARGYFGRPELTAERFMTTSSNESKPLRMYRTGDLARWLPNGEIECLGRLDDQIKIRGYRIEPGEVEVVLNDCPLVRQAVVKVGTDRQGIKQLMAYVIANQEFDKEAIRAYASQKLPVYMVPVVWVEMSVFPLTPNGKLNKKALPVPEKTDWQKTAYVAPRNEREHQLAEIWQQILSIEQVGIDDHFFELGGHSLLATRVVAALRTQLGVQLNVRAIFKTPTIRGLSSIINQSTDVTGLPAIEPVLNRPERIPLSYAQERLWFIDQLSGSTEYHMPFVQEFSAELNEQALAQAFKQLVVRHEVLRTVIRESNGKGYQLVLSADDWQLEQVAFNGSKTSDELKNLITERVNSAFDLSMDYPLRATLIQLKGNTYVLVLVVHHIAFDAWSAKLLLEEIMMHYQAIVQGKPCEANLPEIQYPDYAIWQRRHLNQQALDKKLPFWQDQLQEVKPLNLPLDFVRPAIQQTNGGVQRFEIGKKETEALHALCKKEEVSLFMLLLTIFKVLLYKYSGQTDICVGTVTANRPQQNLEQLIGFFINTIALRSDLRNNPVFLELLAEIKTTSLNAYDHQDVPFEKVVDRLSLERDRSRTPLFQVMFVLQNVPTEIHLDASENTEEEMAFAESQIELSELEKNYRKAKFDLTVNVVEKEAGIQVEFEYSTALFKSSTIERMSSHFNQLMTSVLASPNEKIDALSMLSPAERQQLLIGFNQTKVDYPEELTILDLFEEKQLSHPDHIALVHQEEEMTYAELANRSDLLAHCLRQKGVKENDLVCLCLERSLDLVVAALAVLKSGAAYVPIDPAYPADRIRFILEDTGAAVVLSTKLQSQALKKWTSAELVLLDDQWMEQLNGQPNGQSIQITPGHRAYVIYTSGSTGQPKGVIIRHAALANLVNWHNDVYQVNEKSKATLYAGVGFDASVWEIWPYLSKGAAIHIIPAAIRLSIEGLFDYFVAKKITHSFLPTIIAPDFVKYSRGKENAIEYLLTGGDSLGSLSIKDLSYHFVNNYGPTENAVVTSYHILEEEDQYRNPLIGKQVSNVLTYVLDENQEPVPIGIAGELYIGGKSLASGYLNRPDLNAEKFVSNPFSSNTNEQLYRSGDMVRWLSDGRLEFVGREDKQVQIRGHRVELGEIEAVLMQSELIEQAIVLLQEDKQQRKHLTAYVLLKEESQKSQLRDFMTSRLPSYMVPVFILEMEAFPMTANGKIDKQSLPLPDFSTGLSESYVEASNPTEQILTEIWQNLLGIEKVGIHDNFFELGGDSILSIQLVSRAKREGLELQPKDIFDYQTIAELAAWSEKGGVVIDAEQGMLSGEVPLLPIQQWYLESAYEHKSHFNQSHLFCIDEQIEQTDLSQVVDALVAQHDALRLKFVFEDKQWKQRYVESTEVFHVERVEEQAEKSIGEFISASCNNYQKTLDLSKGQLMKVVFFELPQGRDNRLLIIVHHLAVDGVSWRILISQFDQALRMLRTGESITLGPKTSSYRQWANTLIDFGQSDVVQNQLTYWKSIGKAFQPLPVDEIDQKEEETQLRETIGAQLSVEATRKLLQEVNQIYNTTINDILLAALTQTICDWSQLDGFILGLEGHGREYITRSIDISDTVGWFTSMYPVYLKKEEEGGEGGLIKSIKEQIREIPGKGLGFGLLSYLHHSAEVRNQLKATHWDLVFNYLGQADNVKEAESMIRPADEDRGEEIGKSYPYAHKIEINSMIIDGQLKVKWSYAQHHYHKNTMNHLAEQFIVELEKLIDHCITQSTTESTPHDFGLSGELSTQEFTELNSYLQEIETKGKDILKF